MSKNDSVKGQAETKELEGETWSRRLTLVSCAAFKKTLGSVGKKKMWYWMCHKVPQSATKTKKKPPVSSHFFSSSLAASFYFKDKQAHIPHLRHNLSAYMPNIDGISITSSAVIKDLGVTLDSDLAFDAHIKNISNIRKNAVLA